MPTFERLVVKAHHEHGFRFRGTREGQLAVLMSLRPLPRRVSMGRLVGGGGAALKNNMSRACVKGARVTVVVAHEAFDRGSVIAVTHGLSDLFLALEAQPVVSAPRSEVK